MRHQLPFEWILDEAMRQIDSKKPPRYNLCHRVGPLPRWLFISGMGGFFTGIRMPGDIVCPERRHVQGDADTGTERRPGIFIGPQFGTVSRPGLVAAACERMNPALHLTGDLTNTGKGNPFVIFTEPEIEITLSSTTVPRLARSRSRSTGWDCSIPTPAKYAATVPTASPPASSTPTTTRRASSAPTLLTGPQRPYRALKTTLKAEIDQDTPMGDPPQPHLSPIDRPRIQPIAIKVTNHLGDELTNVFRL